jgi:hypothetical protein
MENNDKNGY